MGISDFVIDLHNKALDNPTWALALRAKDYHLTPECFYEGWAVAALDDTLPCLLNETDLCAIAEACMIAWGFPGHNHSAQDVILTFDLNNRPEVHWNWL